MVHLTKLPLIAVFIVLFVVIAGIDACGNKCSCACCSSKPTQEDWVRMSKRDSKTLGKTIEPSLSANFDAEVSVNHVLYSFSRDIEGKEYKLWIEAGFNESTQLCWITVQEKHSDKYKIKSSECYQK